jgi:predicted nucleic acid-binding protein
MIVVDASALLSALLPDEAQPGAQALIRDHALGRIALRATSLMRYEVCNAVLVAERRGRINHAEAEQIVSALEALGVEGVDLVSAGAILELAREHRRSAYDAAYLALASSNGEELITGDRRLFNAVRDRLDWVRWVGDWGS